MGAAAWRHRRLHPHLVVASFLDRFGDDSAVWALGRHRLTSRAAVVMALQIVKERLGSVRRLLVSVPSVWRPEQAKLLKDAIQEVGFDSLGIVPRELLFGLESSSGESAWKHEGLLLDADERTFTAAILRPTVTDLRQVSVAGRPDLGRAAWRRRLIDAVALRCIATERRDPRATPEAEQLLFDQSEAWFASLVEGQSLKAEAYLSHRALPFVVTLTAADAALACRDLAEAAAEVALALHAKTVRPDAGGMLFLTSEAAQLPGLAARLYEKSAHMISVTAVGVHLAPTALSLAESIAEKERQPLDFAARAVAFPAAEFTFDAPATLPFPGESRPRAAGAGF